jgi:hypothetical protein
MNQSTIIGGAIAAAFIAYLAMTGRLSVYWALMTGGTGGSQGSGSPSVPPNNQVQLGPVNVASGAPGSATAGATPPQTTPQSFTPIGPHTFADPGSPGSFTWDLAHGMWGPQ